MSLSRKDNEKRTTWLCNLFGHKFIKNTSDRTYQSNSCFRCGFYKY